MVITAEKKMKMLHLHSVGERFGFTFTVPYRIYRMLTENSHVNSQQQSLFSQAIT